MSDEVRTVLVVHDDPQTVLACRQALSHGSHRVVSASDAAAAMAEMEERDIAAVVCDVDLAGGQGLAFVIEVRRRWPAVPRIALTARRDFDALLDLVNEAEVLRVLRKPAAPEALAAAIEDAEGRAVALRASLAAQERSERRRLALLDLETDHPGISLVPDDGTEHVIPYSRFRELGERLHGTPLATLLSTGAWPV